MHRPTPPDEDYIDTSGLSFMRSMVLNRRYPPSDARHPAWRRITDLPTPSTTPQRLPLSSTESLPMVSVALRLALRPRRMSHE